MNLACAAATEPRLLPDPAVVYDENGQRELAPHTDGCLVSFNILLSDPADFDGGGTHFLDLAPPDDPDADPAIARDAQARAANPPDTGIVAYSAQGDAVVHSAKLTHAARPVVRGQRLVLVGFADTPGPRADQKADAVRSVYLISVKEGFDDARLDDAITAVTQAGGSVLQRAAHDKFKTLSALAFVDVELDGPVHIAGGN
ncbi:hypothetical protein HK105_202948 [Polyrhizophydium stewartii]|uniref:Fe2OG dioxygenase domain-containing protein n=1 Tax=Polyrhizophydium stewartii TaxID=2732419 RepID=A0ABR4NDS3_9FUNG